MALNILNSINLAGKERILKGFEVYCLIDFILQILSVKQDLISLCYDCFMMTL